MPDCSRRFERSVQKEASQTGKEISFEFHRLYQLQQIQYQLVISQRIQALDSIRSNFHVCIAIIEQSQSMKGTDLRRGVHDFVQSFHHRRVVPSDTPYQLGQAVANSLNYIISVFPEHIGFAVSKSC